uniref:Uncharacterized protein n=1 Tax=Leptobrachium leishanense TaxID=445787 RepID=A0A8C5MBZ2_9ANUR
MWLPLLVIVLALLLLYRWHRQSQILQTLSDKYVLITGCDTGFGNLLARQLDRRGMWVLAACLTEKGAVDLKKRTSSRLQTVILDVADSQSVSSAAKWIAHIVEDKGLWGLVNNAGITNPAAPNEWLTVEDFAKVLNVNLLGTINVTLSLLSLIKKSRGRIVNVSSVMGRLAFAGGGYTISKHGIEAFSDSLRRELRPFGVHVSIIEPGSYKTPATDQQSTLQSINTVWNRAQKSVQDSYGQQYFLNWLWGLVNNVGCGHGMCPNEWQRKEDFAKVLDVNLLGMIDVTLNMLPIIRKSQGRIVNVSSAFGRLAGVSGGYCLSKYGVEAFSDNLRREMRDFGVKVSIIEPGAFKTPASVYEVHLKSLMHFWEKVPSEVKETYGEEYFQQYAENLKLLLSTCSPKLHRVTDAIEHALTAVYPWTRYSPGWDCKLFYLPVSYLPTVISDYVLLRSAPKPAQRNV